MATSKKPTKSAEKAKLNVKQELKVKPEQFSAKVLGKTLIVTFGKNKTTWTKKSATEAEIKKIKDKIALYNKQPKDATYNAIEKLMQPEKIEKAAKTEKVKAAKKGIKQQIKKEAKKEAKAPEVQKDFLTQLDELLASDDKAVEKLEALLVKHKKAKETVEEPKARITGTPQPGEKYRNGVRVSAYYGYKDGKKYEVDREGYIIGEW